MIYCFEIAPSDVFMEADVQEGKTMFQVSSFNNYCEFFFMLMLSILNFRFTSFKSFGILSLSFVAHLVQMNDSLISFV